MAQETWDIQDGVRICARHGVPVIAFGTGTSLEGQVNAPAGGVFIDLRDTNKKPGGPAQDPRGVVQPAGPPQGPNQHPPPPGFVFSVDPGAAPSPGGLGGPPG